MAIFSVLKRFCSCHFIANDYPKFSFLFISGEGYLVTSDYSPEEKKLRKSHKQTQIQNTSLAVVQLTRL